jgi:hypothetical protein
MCALLAALLVQSYAQHLADEVVAQTPGLLVIAMHASEPAYPIVASNIGRIGKPADDDDMRVITTGNTNLEVAHGGTRFEVELAMKDVTGKTVGAIGLVFPYRKGDSKAALEKKAVAIRDRLARRTLDAASLLEPYPFDPLATTKTHAQKLIDELMRKNPKLTLVAIHAVHPKTHADEVIASSFGGIGKHPGLLGFKEIPLLDASGAAVGGLVVQGDDAEKTRDELRKRIPSLDSLIELDP